MKEHTYIYMTDRPNDEVSVHKVRKHMDIMQTTFIIRCHRAFSKSYRSTNTGVPHSSNYARGTL